MKIIHLIDALNKPNRGVISAALATADVLSDKYNYSTEIWFPKAGADSSIAINKNVTQHELIDLSLHALQSILLKRNLQSVDIIFFTHGIWRFPSKWGAYLSKSGYKWICSPHGMLEPWSMSQKKMKKLLYFHLVEKNHLNKASVIRATSTPEYVNLSNTFNNVHLIPNGIIKNNINFPRDIKIKKPITFLFVARLHKKKGIVPLIKAWRLSTFHNNTDFKLVIIGFDDGEGNTINKLVLSEPESKNIEIEGPVYGKDIVPYLQKALFYVLPSYSEGFPMSVLDALNFGIIPIISDGCNFPEVFDNNVGFRITTNPENITEIIQKSVQIPTQNLLEMSEHCERFVKKFYSVENIAKLQYELTTKV